MTRGAAALLTTMIVVGVGYVSFRFAEWVIKKESAPQTAKHHVIDLGYPANTADKQKIRSLLTQRRFDDLNRSIDSIQTAFEKDTRKEFICFDTFESFDSTDSSIEPLLKEWITQTPNAYSHISLALYHYAKAWESRGGKWAKDTSPEQFEGMEKHFDEARKNIDVALQENRRVLSAYWMQIQMHKANGNTAQVRAVFQKGAAVFPQSLILRVGYMDALTPRWGGSYEEMSDSASESEKLQSVNPAFAVLRGLIDIDKGESLENQSHYPEALQFFNASLQIGDYWLFLESRGRLYCEMGRYKESLADLDKALKLRPQRRSTLIYHAGALAYNKRFDESIREFQLAKTLGPNDPELRNWRKASARMMAWAGYKSFRTDRSKANLFFNQAIQLEPKVVDAYFYRAYSLLQTGDEEGAIPDLKTSIVLNPHDIRSYQYIDRILSKQGKWDDIIPYWNQLIALEPGNATAYLERGGVYFHKGDRLSSAADVKKACDLGNQEACTHYRELSGSVPQTSKGG